MAAGAATAARNKRSGMGMLSPAEGIAALAAIMTSLDFLSRHPYKEPIPCMTAAAVKWAKILGQSLAVPMFFEQFALNMSPGKLSRNHLAPPTGALAHARMNKFARRVEGLHYAISAGQLKHVVEEAGSNLSAHPDEEAIIARVSAIVASLLSFMPGVTQVKDPIY